MHGNTILSTLALYEYDNSIFELFRVPEGMNKKSVVNSILLSTAEFSVIYTSPTSLKNFIGIWTDKNFMVWDELWKTTQYEYNPIWNYDRTEHGKEYADDTHKDTHALTNTTNFTRDLSENTTYTGKIENDVSYTDSKGTDVSAFNNGLSPQSTENSQGKTDNDTTQSSNNDIEQKGTTETIVGDTGTLTTKIDEEHRHEFRAYGNIGVTTTQEMIKQQREIVMFNMIDYIVNDYKEHFCIMIY